LLFGTKVGKESGSFTDSSPKLYKTFYDFIPGTLNRRGGTCIRPGKMDKEVRQLYPRTGPHNPLTALAVILYRLPPARTSRAKLWIPILWTLRALERGREVHVFIPINTLA